MAGSFLGTVNIANSNDNKEQSDIKEQRHSSWYCCGNNEFPPWQGDGTCIRTCNRCTTLVECGQGEIQGILIIDLCDGFYAC